MMVGSFSCSTMRSELAPLPVQHALGRRHDHLRPGLVGGQRLLQHVAHAADVVGAIDLAYPVDTHALEKRYLKAMI